MMQAAITDAYDEGQLYLDNAHAIATLPGIFDEVERHRVSMVAILGDMESGVATTTHCMDTSGVNSDRRGIIYDLQMHLSAVHAQTTIYDARLEVDRHVNVTNRFLDDMQSELDTSACMNP